MHENLEKVVRQWRDAGNALLAKDPDDRGTGSSSVRMIWKPRCAPKNRGRSSEQFWQPGRSCSARSSWNTNTVRKLRLTHWPRHGQDYQKFRPYRRMIRSAKEGTVTWSIRSRWFQRQARMLLYAWRILAGRKVLSGGLSYLIRVDRKFMRDIEQIVTSVERLCPGVEVRQLNVSHPEQMTTEFGSSNILAVRKHRECHVWLVCAAHRKRPNKSSQLRRCG